MTLVLCGAGSERSLAPTAAQAIGTDLADLALPDLIPPAAPLTGWRTPASLTALTTPGRPAPLPSGGDEETAPDRRDGWGWWVELVNLYRTTRINVVVVHRAGLHAGLARLLRHCDRRVITTHAALQALHPPAGVAPDN
ncbi:hypothetical protein [Streptomyces sp. NPDC088746]|uniref:hypothetical protein n=1 Tax=Streptomyces sp. NPDC088746 TaxID=3365885 RepID=UPI0037F92018